MKALSFHGVRKTYPTGFLHLERRAALDGLTFEIEAGESYGLIGPNGAGKTTAFSLIFGFSRADAGTVTVLGETPGATAWKRRASYLPEQPYLHEYLTIREAVEMATRLHGMSPSEGRRSAGAWLERVELSRHADRRIGHVSKGMKQRVALAMALATDPEFVVLDEPTSGLDPLGRALVRRLIDELRSARKTVLFSTHILTDAEDLCDRVGFIDSGRLIAEGRLEALLDAEGDEFEVLVRDSDDAAAPRREKVSRDALPARLDALTQAGSRILHAIPARESLDELYARRFGRGAPGTKR